MKGLKIAALFALLVTGLWGNAVIGQTTTITPQVPTTCSRGDTISIPIMLNAPALSNVRGFTFDFTFDVNYFDVFTTGVFLVNYSGSILGTENSSFYVDDSLAGLANGVVTLNLARLGASLATAEGLIGTVKLKVKNTATFGGTPTFCVNNPTYVDNQFYQVNLGNGCGSTQIGDRPIWPGDANDDGTCTSLDYNVIATRIGRTGPARSATNYSWSAKTAPADWSTTTTIQGKVMNDKYLDANGNGSITLFDVGVTIINRNKTHQ